MSFKPYVKKPLVHSPRGEEVLASVKGYIIKTAQRTGPGQPLSCFEAKITDVGQCIAALRRAKQHHITCLVYAYADVLGEECLELVDEEFLMGRLG